MTPEDVAKQFKHFLSEDITPTEEGYGDFVFDDRLRILLAAGNVSPEITTPVV